DAPQPLRASDPDRPRTSARARRCAGRSSSPSKPLPLPHTSARHTPVAAPRRAASRGTTHSRADRHGSAARLHPTLRYPGDFGRGAGQGHRAAADPSSLHATTTKVARATRLGRPHRLERAALSANPQTSVSTPESPELYLEGEAFHRA